MFWIACVIQPLHLGLWGPIQEDIQLLWIVLNLSNLAIGTGLLERDFFFFLAWVTSHILISHTGLWHRLSWKVIPDTRIGFLPSMFQSIQDTFLSSKGDQRRYIADSFMVDEVNTTTFSLPYIFMHRNMLGSKFKSSVNLSVRNRFVLKSVLTVIFWSDLHFVSQSSWGVNFSQF